MKAAAIQHASTHLPTSPSGACDDTFLQTLQASRRDLSPEADARLYPIPAPTVPRLAPPVCGANDAPATSSEVDPRILFAARAIAKALRTSPDVVVFDLRVAGLGRIRIRVKKQGNRLGLSLRATRSATQALLEEHLDRLRTLLHTCGCHAEIQAPQSK